MSGSDCEQSLKCTVDAGVDSAFEALCPIVYQASEGADVVGRGGACVVVI
jgi:hypothetical protein